jgi:hypothetical protein
LELLQKRIAKKHTVLCYQAVNAADEYSGGEITEMHEDATGENGYVRPER